MLDKANSAIRKLNSLGYTYDGVKWAVSGQQAEPTQEQLDAFILRAGFRWGWENVESAARMMARQAVTELNALAGQQSERPILAHEAALSGEYHKGYLQGQREARIALAAATPPTPEPAKGLDVDAWNASQGVGEPPTPDPEAEPAKTEAEDQTVLSVAATLTRAGETPQDALVMAKAAIAALALDLDGHFEPDEVSRNVEEVGGLQVADNVFQLTRDDLARYVALSTPPTPEAEPQALLGWTRYEKARKLNPAQWAELHQRNLKGERFDEMIDALPATTQPVQQDTLRLKTAQVDVRTILEAQGIYLSTPTIDAIVRAATPPAEKQAAPSGEDNHG